MTNRYQTLKLLALAALTLTFTPGHLMAQATPTTPAGHLAQISMSGPQAAATPGRARVSRAIPTSPSSPGNGR